MVFGMLRKEREVIISKEEVEAKREATNKFRKWVAMEEVSWRQELRELWLKKGDKSMKLFYKMSNACKRRNHLVKIKMNDEFLSEDTNIKEAMTKAFYSLLFEMREWRSNITGMSFDISSNDDLESL